MDAALTLAPLTPGYVSPPTPEASAPVAYRAPRGTAGYDDLPFGTVPAWDVRTDPQAWLAAIVAWAHGISISSLTGGPRPSRRLLDGDPTVRATVNRAE